MVAETHQEGDESRRAESLGEVLEVDRDDHQRLVRSRLGKRHIEQVRERLDDTEDPERSENADSAQRGTSGQDTHDRRSHAHPETYNSDFSQTETRLNQERSCHIPGDVVSQLVDRNEQEDGDSVP